MRGEAETGVVTAIEEGVLLVRLPRSEACAKCGACAAGLLEKEMIMTAKNSCGARIGDSVRLELEGSVFIKSAFIMYGFPLLAMVAGFLAGMGFCVLFPGYIDGELFGFLTGVLALMLSYYVIKRNERRFKGNKYKPEAVEVIV
jgi:sigma-E factor negative regulatory protein RseC